MSDERFVVEVGDQRGVLVEEAEVPRVVGSLSTQPEFEHIESPLLLDFAYKLIDAITIPVQSPEVPT